MPGGPWRQGRAWGQGNPTQGIAQVINSQPLGLNEEQGQQLLNHISQQVLQNIGSTAQIQNFDSPGGISDRFGSFSPSQLLPSGVAPVGFVDGNVNRDVRDLLPFNGNIFDDRQSFNPNTLRGDQVPPGRTRPEMMNNLPNNLPQSHHHSHPPSHPPSHNPSLSHRLLHNPFPGNHGVNHISESHNINEPLSPYVPLLGAGLLGLLSQTSIVQVPTNDRQGGKQELIHEQNFRGDSSILDAIRQENEQLRKLIRQKKRKLNNAYKEKEKPKEKNNKGGMAAGLILGALGALVLG